MKIKIAKNDLLDGVNKVKSVVSAKSALPILSHILLEAADNSVKLSATDLKVSIECTVDCTVETPGSMTVSSHRLASILSELPDADLTLSLGDSNVVGLDCEKIRTKLFSMHYFLTTKFIKGLFIVKTCLQLKHLDLEMLLFREVLQGICHNLFRTWLQEERYLLLKS